MIEPGLIAYLTIATFVKLLRPWSTNSDRAADVLRHGTGGEALCHVLGPPSGRLINGTDALIRWMFFYITASVLEEGMKLELFHLVKRPSAAIKNYN